MREVSVQQEGQYLDASLSARIRLDKALYLPLTLGLSPPHYNGCHFVFPALFLA